ncbi:MAG: hypothetical protein HUU21_40970 [Polyangiaceae bacterium]|nr:hypothetical protein [Polyangiaceae bacterium]
MTNYLQVSVEAPLRAGARPSGAQRGAKGGAGRIAEKYRERSNASSPLDLKLVY